MRYMKITVPHVNAHQLGTLTEEALNNTVDKRTHSVDCQPFPLTFLYPDKWAHKIVTMAVGMGFVNGLQNIKADQSTPIAECQIFTQQINTRVPDMAPYLG